MSVLFASELSGEIIKNYLIVTISDSILKQLFSAKIKFTT